MLKGWIIALIDFFYPPFRKLLPIQTFIYAACGGGNMMLYIFLYLVSYNFLILKLILFTLLVAMEPHIAAFLMSFAFSFPTVYLLNKYIVFTGSIHRVKVQLFRYFLLVVLCVFLNYIFIKL